MQEDNKYHKAGKDVLVTAMQKWWGVKPKQPAEPLIHTHGIDELRCCQTTTGQHSIKVTHENGDVDLLVLDLPSIAKDKKLRRELLTGLGNILLGLSCHDDR
jgi:hypothetical protein